MSIFNYSQLISNNEIRRLLELLPLNEQPAPTIYLFDNWKAIVSAASLKKDLHYRYTALKKIVNERIFSTYNYQYNTIFIYLFNLPYNTPSLTKLHSVFCLFHEMRHFYQYQSRKEEFLIHTYERSSYVHSWVEKDANKHAVKWMRRNRNHINEILSLEHPNWDIKVNKQKKLRIVTDSKQVV